MDKAIIDWKGNCGNLTSAVGIFAIAQNLLKPVEPLTTVRIYNTNTDKIIHVIYPVKDGLALSEGIIAFPECLGPVLN